MARLPKRRIFQPVRATHTINGIAITSPDPVNIETGGPSAQIAWAFSYLQNTTNDVLSPPSETPTFKSSNTAVCTVSSAGVIAPVGNGTATVMLRVSSGATASLTVAVTTPIETVQSVVLSPSSGTAQVGANVMQLTATAYAGLGGTGNIIPDQVYTANSSDTGKATVAQSGDVCTVTPVAAGSTNVKVTTSGIDSNLVPMTIQAAAVAASNEPVGFTPIARYTGGFTTTASGVVPIPYASGALLGTWTCSGLRLAATDASAPISPTATSRYKFPSGLTAGYGTSVIRCDFAAQQKLYERGAFMFEGSDWEMVGNGILKMFGYWGVGASTDVEVFVGVYNGGAMALQTEWNLRFQQQTIASRATTQSLNTATKVQVGTWHTYEILMERNTVVDVADGTFKMWLDGTQVFNLTNVIYWKTGMAQGFHNKKLDTIWGGGTGTKTRDDYLQWDDIYISGVPI